MIKERIIEKVVHQWYEKDDRWVYIEYDNQRKIVGLNFMQGDDYQYFKLRWACNDQGLMDFYNSMVYTFPIEKASVNTLEFISKVMWAYHLAIVSYEDHTDFQTLKQTKYDH